jgi:hypothetical protein
MNGIVPTHPIRKSITILIDSLSFNSFIGVVIIVNLLFVGLQADFGEDASGNAPSCTTGNIMKVSPY